MKPEIQLLQCIDKNGRKIGASYWHDPAFWESASQIFEHILTNSKYHHEVSINGEVFVVHVTRKANKQVVGASKV